MTKPTKKRPALPSQRRKHPRATRDANAELLLLQSLALRIGQEAARQNGIAVEHTLPLNDPHGANLATLPGVGDKPITLRATISVTVNPNTGAVVAFTPPTH